jgi:tetratricopeptide (TPR) repeat protein
MSPDLSQQARALDERATELVLAGRLDEALPVCRESVETHRTLAADRDEQLLDFAIALQRLSAVLQWTGRLPETVPSLREELAIRRRLAAGNDPEPRRELARVLGILGTALASVGNAEEATSVAADSVEICRELFTLDPTAYRESLGHSLTDMVRVYVGCELFEYADIVAGEATQTWRGSEDHLIYLAEVLHMHAFALSQIGSNEAALARLGESIEIYERLGEEGRPQFAGGLMAYGRLLGVAGRTREATQFLIKALVLADRFGYGQTIEGAVGLLHDAYRADPRAMTEEWKKATETKVPRWLRR